MDIHGSSWNFHRLFYTGHPDFYIVNPIEIIDTSQREGGNMWLKKSCARYAKDGF